MNPINSVGYNPNNYNKAFESLKPQNYVPFNGVKPKDMFLNKNFVNDNSIFDNNLHKNLLAEEIKEYTVMIDSKDRNYQIFPNPYHYDVVFSPLPNVKRFVDGKAVTYETPNPTINTGFTNVRYIKLEMTILPFYNKICKKTRKLDEPNKFGLDDYVIDEFVDVHNPVTENLYTVLMIEEYKDVNYKSTNDVLSDSFCTIYYDGKINDSHYKGETYSAIKIFPPDQLGKIDKFRIRFLDPYGCELSVNHLDPSLKSGMTCCCGNEDESCCFKHNLNHPLNPLWQNHLQFKIGVVEQYLNKKIVN